MTRIRTKSDLIAWLEEYAPCRALQKALREAKIELLGWFTLVPGSFKPGWVLEITSKYHLKWIIAVSVGITSKLNAYVIDKIEWENYNPECWQNSDPDCRGLFAGDNPKKYKGLRDEHK